MIVFPNAKINLGLNILSRRPDGYHNISTLMVPIGWCDILEIVPSKTDNDSLTLFGRSVNCPNEKNLVWKALQLMRAETLFPAVDIYLRKIIPDGAGLGGGSADAAFTLSTINSLFDLQISSDRLKQLAARLGADCPFFIENVPALASDTGTTLLPLPHFKLPPGHLVVVKPPVSVSTAEAYSGVTPAQPETPLSNLLEKPCHEWQNSIVNDFETSVFATRPEIAQIKQRLIDHGAVYASMSGSGSSVFGLFQSDIVADRLSQQFPDSDFFHDTIA